jgi:hypothetical protein
MAQNTNYKSFKFKQADIGKFNTNSNDVATLINKGSRVMGLTDGRFSLIDLIRSLLTVTGPADVVATTWSAGIKDANQVAWMKNSSLIRSFTLVTDHSYVNRQKAYAINLEQLFGKENIRTSEVHAKFTLISNEDWKICIRTSMNLNANKTCESFEIDENSEIFDFYHSFVKHVFDNQPAGMISDTGSAERSMNSFFGKVEGKKEERRQDSGRLRWSND